MIVDKVFDRTTGKPYKYAGRIQNVSSTVGILADRYSAYGRTSDLELAGAHGRLPHELPARRRRIYERPYRLYISDISGQESLELADAERAAGRNKQAKVRGLGTPRPSTAWRPSTATSRPKADDLRGRHGELLGASSWASWRSAPRMPRSADATPRPCSNSSTGTIASRSYACPTGAAAEAR